MERTPSEMQTVTNEKNEYCFYRKMIISCKV